MKENFLLKKELNEVVEQLSDEDTGKLFKGILKYVCEGTNDLDGYLKIIFIPIKNDIDKNELEYQKRCEMNRNNGARGGAPKGNQNAKKEKTTERLKKQPKTTENNMTRHNHIHSHNNNKFNINNSLNIIKQVIDYLNNKINSKYKYNTKITQQKIIARLNEGYNLDDFIAVVDKKTLEWIGTEMEEHLCPETLFGAKFEKYLNQKVVTDNKQKIIEAAPEWMNQDIKSTIATKEEQEQLMKSLGELNGTHRC